MIVSVTDDVAPVTGLVANNGRSNDTTLTIGGTAEAGSTVTVYDTDGTTVLGTGVATGGAFTITTSVLGEGTHTLTARATDAAGNQGASSTAFHVTIDTVAPVAPSITAFSVDSGTVGDHLTNDRTLTLSGTAGAAGNTVEIFQDGVSIGTTVADIGGNWSLADATSLVDGTYQFTARATDGAGNQGPLSAAFQVTIDATAPGAPTFGSVTDDVAPVIGLVADNGSSNDPTLSIDGTAEPGSTVTVYDTDGTTVVGTGLATGGAGPIITSPLSEGAHTLTLKATDAAGNQSAASTAFHVTIDTMAPLAPVIDSVTDDVAPVTGAVADNGSSNDPTLTIGGTAEAGSTVTVYDTDGTTVLGTGVATGGVFTITTSVLDEGAHALTATASDAAGNQSAASTAFQVIIDTTAPLAPVIVSVTDDVAPVTGLVANNGSSNDTTLTIGGTAEAGSTVTVYDTDGTTVLGTGVATGGAFTITTSVLGEGAHTLTARATDAAGNQGASSTAFHVTIDTVAPVAPSITAFSVDSGTVGDHLTNDRTLTLSGTAGAAGNTVEIFQDGVSIGTTVADIGGNWSLADASSLVDGAYQFTARATDGAGNQGPLSAAFQVTIDATAPGAPTFGSVTDDVAPVIGLVADNGSSNDPTLSIDGTAELGSTVTVYDTDGTTVVGTGLATGGAGPIITSPLSEGAHTLTLKATDAAGNQSAASTAFHVTIDTVAPLAPVIDSVTDDVAPVTGAVADNGSSNDPTLTIGGTAEAGSTVTVYDTDGTTVLGTGVATGGVFTITTSVLDEGAHALTATASDAAGNQSAASTAFQVIIDTSGAAVGAGDRQRDRRRGAGDRPGGEQRQLERHHADDRRDGGGGQHGDGLRHRRHDGAGDRRGDRRGVHDHDLGAGRGHPCPDGEGDGRGGQPGGVRNGVPCHHRHGGAGGAVDHGVLGRQRDGGRPPHQRQDADAERHGRGGGQHGGDLPGRRVDRHDGGRHRRQLEPGRRQLSGGRRLPVHGEGDGRGRQPGAALGGVPGHHRCHRAGGSDVRQRDRRCGAGDRPGGGQRQLERPHAVDRRDGGAGQHGDGLRHRRHDGSGDRLGDRRGGADHHFAAERGGSYPDVEGDGRGGQPKCCLDGVPRHHRHGGAVGAGDRQRDRRRGAGDRRGGGQRQLERPDADDRRDGGGGQHGDGLRHRRHDGAGDRRGDRRGVHDHDLGAGRGRPCADGHGERCGGQPKCCLSGIPGHHRHPAPLAPVIVSVTDDVAPVTGLVANNGRSNDTTLTIGGTAEAGSTVTVYDTDGTTVLGTGVATGGAFTITTSVLGEGTHTLTARATDAAGNQGASSTAFRVTIDTVAPVAPSITAFSDDSGTVGDHLTNDRTLTLSGTAGAAGNTVEIFQDGVSIGTTVADIDGNWSLADASSLVDGAYQFTARATDGAGNQGPLSAAFQVTIDATAPGAPTFGSVTDDVAPVIGLVADNGSSNDPTLSIDGTAELGSTVTVYDTDGTTVVGTGVATGGAGPIITSPLSEGAHTLTLKATDAAGNQSAASTAFHVTIDTVAPSAPVIDSVTDDVAPVTGAVADNGSSNDPTLTIGGTAEAGSTVTVYDTDGTTVLGTGVATGGVFTITTSVLDEGAHALTATASDAAGNQSAASTAFQVIIDTLAPLAPVIVSVTDDVAPVTGLVANNGRSNDTTLTIGGTAEAGSTVTVYDTDGTTVLGTGVATGGAFTITTSVLGEGTHTLTARATDAAGNQGASSTAFRVTIDTVAPVAPSITAFSVDSGTVGDHLTNDRTLTLSGTAGAAGNTVEIFQDGVSIGTTVADIGGNWSLADATSLADGTYQFTARATDGAGNQGPLSAAFQVTIDATAPGAPTFGSVTDNVAPVIGLVADNGSSNDPTLSIDGTAEPGSTVTVYDTDGTTVVGTGLATGGAGPIITSPLSEGAHTLTLKATDAAGNQSAASTAFHVTIDTVAPSAPVIDSVTDDVAPVTGAVADNGSSNDPTLTIGGTAEAGSTVTVYDTDGTTVLGTGVATGGVFTITTSVLDEGAHALTATASDAAGNQSAASTAFQVIIDTLAPLAPVIVSVTDDVAPVTGLVANNGSSNDTTLTIGGTAEAGSTVTVYDTDGTTVLGTGVATGGAFTITTSVLGEGAHTLTARATDAAGNQGASSTAFHVTIDTSAPGAPSIVTVTDDVAPVIGAVADNGSSNDSTLTIGGTADAGSTVTLYDTDGTTVVGTGLAASGVFTITTSVLGEGTHTLTARATDAAGNQGASSTAFHVTIDTLAPAVAITTIEGGDDLINAAEAAGGVTVSGTAEIGSTLTVNGVAVTVDASGGWTTSVATAGEGLLMVTAVATDAAGNSATATHDLTVDTVAPAVAITTIEGGDDLINAAEAAGGVTVSGTAEIGATLTVNGVAVTVDASGGWTTSVATAGEGLLVVTAVATDAAGNSATATHDLTVDTVAPAVAITTIEGGDDLINAAEAAGGVTVSGTAEIGATLTVNGVAVTVDASGGWTTSVATAGEGLLVVTAVATDAAGNSATATHDLTVDTLAPAVAITTIEGGDDLINAAEAAGGVTVSGTAEIGATLTVNGVAVTVDASGGWTTSVATAGEGLLVVTAVATDAAGNSATATHDLTVDTVAPAVAITTIEGGDDLINAAEAAGGVTVSGTAEIGATLTVNGVAVTVDASGGWTTSVATAGDGLLVVTAVATDAAGNSATATHDLTVDTLAPAVAITTIEGGDDLINAAEAAGGVTVSGTAEIGSTLTVNGVAVTVDASGGWTTSVATAGEGLLVVTAVATDAAGNSATATHDLTVDTLAPAVAITTIEGGDDLINAAEAAGGVTVSGTAEIGATLTVNGVAVTVDASGGWTTSVATAGDGLLMVTAVATDAAGNSATATHELTVDTVAPAVAITTIEGGDDLINAAEAAGGVTVSGTAEIGSTLTVNGVAVTVDASGGWTTSVAPAGDGPLTVTAVATDAAGNSATATHDLTVDTVAPAAPSITSIPENGGGGINASEASDGTPVVVGLTGTGAVAGDRLTINWGGQTVNYTLLAGDISGNSATVTVPLATITAQGQGTFDVTATLTDAAGNASSNSAAASVTVDTVAPAAPSITSIPENGGGGINASEASDGTPVVVGLTGTGAVAGDRLTINWGGQTVNYTLLAGDISGNSATVTVPLATITAQGQGTFDVTATLTDAARAISANSTAASVTVDTLPPAVAITTIEGGDDLINAAEAAGGITVSGTAEIGSTLTVNGAAVTVDASGGWTTSVTAAGDGPLTVTAVATDAAGNTATATRDLTVDMAPPAPSITSIPENGGGGINASEASDGTPVVVGLTGTGAVAGDRLTINWGGQTVDYTLLAADISGNSATVTVPLATITAQGQGTFDVTATLTDAAGNASSNSAPASVTVDTVAPRRRRSPRSRRMAEAASTPARPRTARRWWWA